MHTYACRLAVAVFVLGTGCDDPPALGHIEIALASYNRGELGIENLRLEPSRLEVVHSETPDSDTRIIVISDELEALSIDVFDDIRELPLGGAPVPVGYVHQIRLVTPDGVVRTGRLDPDGELLTIPSGTQTGIKANPENGEPFPIREGAVTRILVLLNAGEVIHAPGCGFDSVAGRCRAHPAPRERPGRETPGGNHVFPDYIMRPTLPARLRQVTGPISPQFAQDQLFVMFAPGTDGTRAEAVASSLGASVLRQIPGRPWYTFLLPVGSDESAIADSVTMLSDVRIASPNYAIHFLNAPPPELDMMPAGLQYDPYWLRLTQTFDAWDVLAATRGEAARYGDARPLVAVPDNSPYPANPDLQHAMFFNPGELPTEVGLRLDCTAATPIILVDADVNGDGATNGRDYDVTGPDGTSPPDGVVTLADFNTAPYQQRLNAALNTLNGTSRTPTQTILVQNLLAPNRFDREVETCGLFENRADDDGDTRADDIIGWNFVIGDNWTYSPDMGSADPSTPLANTAPHGTLVAGLIAAAVNDRSLLGPALDLESYVGIAPTTRLLPLTMLGSRPGEPGEGELLSTETGFEAWMDRMVETLDYAVQHGSHVINASWSIKCAPAKDGIPQALICSDEDRAAKERRFQAAFDELDAVGLDSVLVVTSGVDYFVDLDRVDVQDLPGELHRPNFIMVTASDEADALNDLISFGDETYDLAAPGRAMPVITALGRTVDPLGNPISGLYTRTNDAGTRILLELAGTSLAAPEVAGAAALVMSVCPARMGDPIAVRQILIDNADCGLPGLSGRVRGACRLNVLRAIEAVMPERGGVCSP